MCNCPKGYNYNPRGQPLGLINKEAYMETRKTDLDCIKEHMEQFYDIERITEAGRISIGKEIYKGYYFFIKHEEVITEHLVFRYGKCIDMLSKSAQVKEFGESFDVIFIGEEHAPILEYYKNGDDFNLDTILVYPDYISLREHFFEGKRLVQVAQWLRNDTARCALNWEQFGRYVLTQNICE